MIDKMKKKDDVRKTENDNYAKRGGRNTAKLSHAKNNAYDGKSTMQ